MFASYPSLSDLLPLYGKESGARGYGNELPGPEACHLIYSRTTKPKVSQPLTTNTTSNAINTRNHTPVHI